MYDAIVMSLLFQHDVAMLFWCNSEIDYVLCQLNTYLIERVETIINIEK